MLCFAQLGSYFTGTGGPVLYAGTAFGPIVGFQVGWCLYIARLLSFAANVNLLVSSLAYFLGPGLRVILLFAVCSVVTLLNVAGSRDAMRGLSVLTILKFLPLVAMAEMVAEEQTIGIWSDVPDSAVRFIRWEAVVRLAAGGLSSRQQS
jgi:amino acid transporter